MKKIITTISMPKTELNAFRNAFKIKPEITDELLLSIIMENLSQRYFSTEYFRQEDFEQ